MVDVAARHKHTFFTNVDMLYTNCARRSFQLIFFTRSQLSRLRHSLAMLVFYFYNGKLSNHLRVALIFLSVPFRLLF